MTDYGYLYARLKGMKSRLLAREEIDRLVKARDPAELLDLASRTGLKPAIERARIRREGAEALEEAVRTDFAAACRKVLTVAEGRGRELVRALLLRWDVFNLKTVLRGKHAGIPPADLSRSLVPAGGLDGRALDELGAQPGVREAVDLLATWGHSLAEPLAEALPGYEADGSLVRLELALDRAAFRQMLAAAKGPGHDRALVRDLVRREIDASNVVAKMRLLADDIDTFVENKAEHSARLRREREEERRRRAAAPVRAPRPTVRRPWRSAPAAVRVKPPPPPVSDYFIPGGEETGGKRLLELLRSRSWPELRAFLQGTSFGRHLGAEAELGPPTDLGAFERLLAMERYRGLASLHRREPPGMAMAISYLWLKQAELVNLRTIARGKEFGVPEAVIRGELASAS